MPWMYAVCFLSLFVCLPCFLFYKYRLRYRLAAAYKSMGTLCAASLALIAAVRLDQHCWICFAALLLHSVADYILEFSFFLGAGFFLAGHICYIGFFSSLFPPAGIHLIICLCLLGICAFLLWRWRTSIGKKMIVLAVYAAVLSVACSFAIAGLTGHTLRGQLIAAGGALFFLSDIMLLGRMLFSSTRAVDVAIMVFYYAAQLLFGVSCLV